VTVEWTIANNGATATNRIVGRTRSTFRRIRLWSGNDTLVFAAPHFGVLQVGATYDTSATFTLPPSAEGMYLIVKTNVSTGLVGPENPSLLDDVKAILGRFEAAIGAEISSPNFAAGISQLSRGQVISLLRGGSVPGDTLVFEGPYVENNTRAVAATVTPTPADLAVTSVVITPAPGVGGVFSGEKINVTWTVQNQGQFAVYAGTDSWVDYLFVSPDPDFIASRAGLAGSKVHDARGPPLAPGESYTTSTEITLPAGISGTWYVHVFTDIGIYRGSPVLSPVGPGKLAELAGNLRQPRV
jgi:hypothetical protein